MDQNQTLLGPNSQTFKQALQTRSLFGGGAALLMQTAHPSVGHAVGAFSTFKDDPWKRLDHTAKIVFAGIILGEGGRYENANLLNNIHKNIKGTNFQMQEYTALDKELYWWVLSTLVDVGIKSSDLFGPKMSQSEKKSYYYEFKEVGSILGLSENDMCPDLLAFQKYMQEMNYLVLSNNSTVQTVLGELKNPKAPPGLNIEAEKWQKLVGIRAGNFLELVSIGLLPDVLRTKFNLSWTERKANQLRNTANFIRKVYPLLPSGMKTSPWAVATKTPGKESGILKRVVRT